MNRFKKKIFYFVLICVAIGGLSTSVKAVPILSFDVSNPTPLVGEGPCDLPGSIRARCLTLSFVVTHSIDLQKPGLN